MWVEGRAAGTARQASSRPQAWTPVLCQVMRTCGPVAGGRRPRGMLRVELCATVPERLRSEKLCCCCCAAGSREGPWAAAAAAAACV